MKSEIILKSRNTRHIEHKLIEVGNNHYKLVTEGYIRTGQLPNGNKYLDPEGGPFLTKGFVIPGEKASVADIYKDYVIIDWKQ